MVRQTHHCPEFIEGQSISRGGGTGRRAGLKILYSQGCEGSTPSLGTNRLEPYFVEAEKKNFHKELGLREQRKR